MNFCYCYTFSEASVINCVIIKGKIMQVSRYTCEAGEGMQVQVKIQILLAKKRSFFNKVYTESIGKISNIKTIITSV